MIEIKTIEKINCYLCGSKGELLYKNLKDKLYNAPGQWSFFRCENKECSLIWLNPMPIEEDIYLAYKSYYTHSDEFEDNSASFKKRFYKKIQNEYLSAEYGYNIIKSSLWKNILYLDPDRLEQTKYKVMYLKNTKGRLLDIGCGSGSFIEFMNKHGWETYGIDFDDKAIEKAKEKKLDVRLGTLEEQQFPDNFFDAITLSHVIEHIYNPLQILKECYRILKLNGKIVIATPNNESLGHKYFKKNWRGLEPPRHIHIFSPKSLRAIINHANFGKSNLFTTAKLARYIFFHSGETILSDQEITTFTKVSVMKAKLFSYVEWMLIKMKKKFGEELILIAEK